MASIIAFGHANNKTRREIAEDLEMDVRELDLFMTKYKLSRVALGFKPLFGSTVPIPEKPARSRLTEKQIEQLYAGRRYEDYHIKTSGRVVSLPRISGTVLTRSSADF